MSTSRDELPLDRDHPHADLLVRILKNEIARAEARAREEGRGAGLEEAIRTIDGLTLMPWLKNESLLLLRCIREIRSLKRAPAALSDAEKLDAAFEVLSRMHPDRRDVRVELSNAARELRAQAEPVDVFDACAREMGVVALESEDPKILREWFGPVLDFVRDYSHPECGPITSVKAKAVLAKLDQRAREAGR